MASDQQRDQLEGQVTDRAVRDPKFRQALIRNPRQVLSDELGVELPSDVDLHVVEETASTFYLVLPPAEVSAGSELSDRDLASVAGGWSGDSDCGSCSCDRPTCLANDNVNQCNYMSR